MNTKARAAAPDKSTTASMIGDCAMSCDCGAKVQHSNDLHKVWKYFLYKVGTTLDCAHDTGVLRNSITYYVDYLESIHELQAICRKPDATTGYLAKHYSADKSKWKVEVNHEPSLFDNEKLWGIADE